MFCCIFSAPSGLVVLHGSFLSQRHFGGVLVGDWAELQRVVRARQVGIMGGGHRAWRRAGIGGLLHTKGHRMAVSPGVIQSAGDLGTDNH